MSLLSEAMDKCIFMEKTKTDDGYGGYIDTYREGVEFDAAITFDTSIEARVGDKQGVTSLYTVTTSKGMTLEYHDVIKRKRDNKVFRITSDGDDKYTPASASLNMRQVTAEEFKITANAGGSNG